MSDQGSIETLEAIAERHFSLAAFMEMDPDGLKALLADPATLAHIPGVKALREETERLKTDLGIERRLHAKLEAQLAALQATAHQQDTVAEKGEK